MTLFWGVVAYLLYVSARAVADVALTSSIREIHQMSRGSYGAPRVHVELRLGQGVRVGRKRVSIESAIADAKKRLESAPRDAVLYISRISFINSVIDQPSRIM